MSNVHVAVIDGHRCGPKRSQRSLLCSVSLMERRSDLKSVWTPLISTGFLCQWGITTPVDLPLTQNTVADKTAKWPLSTTSAVDGLNRIQPNASGALAYDGYYSVKA